MSSVSLRPRWKYNRVTAALAKAYFWQRWKNLERVVFVATTGRTGTLSLAAICDALDDVAGYHEPHPIMHKTVLAAANAGDEDYVSRVYWTIKAVNIRRRAAGTRTYVEANHLFIKTFADLALQDFGSRLSVIHLVRDPVSVANSLYQIEGASVGTPGGNDWYLDFRSPSNLIDLRDELEDGGPLGDPFHRGLWYWYETEERIRVWRERHPEVPVVSMDTSSLSDPAAVVGMLSELGIESDRDRVAGACGTRLHEKLHQKTRKPLEPDVAQAKHEEFLSRLKPAN